MSNNQPTTPDQPALVHCPLCGQPVQPMSKYDSHVYTCNNCSTIHHIVKVLPNQLHNGMCPYCHTTELDVDMSGQSIDYCLSCKCLYTTMEVDKEDWEEEIDEAEEETDQDNENGSITTTANEDSDEVSDADADDESSEEVEENLCGLPNICPTCARQLNGYCHGRTKHDYHIACDRCGLWEIISADDSPKDIDLFGYVGRNADGCPQYLCKKCGKQAVISEEE